MERETYQISFSFANGVRTRIGPAFHDRFKEPSPVVVLGEHVDNGNGSLYRLIIKVFLLCSRLDNIPDCAG
ncbi:MAG: hypothetical protein BMS9Abin05_2697 [Rhodothermia bacterium]|nr:MAG: hypothetical protein BMS9Abin05_2697 [Rhodothermia bacterium]